MQWVPHTDHISFSNSIGNSYRSGLGDRSNNGYGNGNHRNRTFVSNSDYASGSRRTVQNGKWRPPTMTVTIPNNEQQTRTTNNNRSSSAGRERPTASRRTSNPAPEQFSDYVDPRSISKPFIERSAVLGDRTQYRPGHRAEVMRMGIRQGDAPIVRNMSTGLNRNTRPDLRGGLNESRQYTTGTCKDVHGDEGKRPSLTDRFRDVDARKRFRGKIVSNQRQRSTIRNPSSQRQPRPQFRNDPQGVRTGGMLDPYPAGDDRWRRSHHIDSTLVSKVKIQAMRQMRYGDGGQGDGQSQRLYQEEQDSRQYDQAVRDTYAPEFSASASKPQPIARRQDNVRGEEWFANTTYDGRTTMHKFGW